MTSFGKGLFRFDPEQERFQVYASANGLQNPNLWAVYQDNNGYLWLSTDGGITRFDPRTERFITFLAATDGLNFDDFSMLAHARDDSGRLYFGNPKGISLFKPEAVKLDHSSPRPCLTKVEIDYQLDDKNRARFFRKQALVLKPGEQNLDLSFSALNMRQAEKVSFQFKVDDGNWISDEDGRISLGRPEAGIHQFQIRALNKDLFQSKPLNLSLMVIPPITERWWFRLIILFSVMLLLAASTYAWQRRKYRRRIQVLETERKLRMERERISRDLHDHVGAHLSRIASDLDLMSPKTQEEEVQEALLETRNFTSETIQLLRDTIWAMDQDHYSLAALEAKMRTFLQQYLVDIVDWDLQVEGDRNWTLSATESINILRILQEASQNMLKYSQASRYEVFLLVNNNLKLRIKDNGIGFQQKRNEGEHYGLNNMKKRAQEMGASFWINGENGVQISLELELKNRGPQTSVQG